MHTVGICLIVDVIDVYLQESPELTSLTHGDNLPIYTADLNETPKLTFQV